MTIKILFFGDIVGKPGRRAIAKIVPEWKKKYQPDLILANAENLAHGVGVTDKTLRECQEAGIDFFTSGNHIWKKEGGITILEQENSPIIRPANYVLDTPGQGKKILKIGKNSGLVVNLIGRVFLEEERKRDCPFRTADKILAETNETDLAFILVDFHAEATSEKIAIGHYLDGRVSVVLGTHTHIPTADAQILSQGTAYVTDVGMVGLKDSVIGANKEVVIKGFLEEANLLKIDMHDLPERGICVVNAILVEINPKTRQAVNFTRLDTEVEI